MTLLLIKRFFLALLCMPLLYAALSFAALPFAAGAAVDLYPFDTDAQRQRYLLLVDELRCPKCQNQNLAGSNSAIAQDLRAELYRLLSEGKSDREIKAFMVARYGDYVLYQPPLRDSTLLLWGLPLLLLVIGALVLVGVVRHRRRQPVVAADLSAGDRSRLARLLDDSPTGDGGGGV